MEVIYAAAESRDDVRLLSLLLTTSIDSRNTTGHTALMFAADKGSIHAVQTLMEKGADPNGKSNNGNTALMFASKRGNVAVIERLLRNGASCTAKNNNGDWALTFAVSEGKVSAAEVLLASGGAANIDTKNNDGETALMMACKNRAHTCIDLLFRNNASDKITNNDEKTAYDLCKDQATKDHLQRVVREFHILVAAEENQRYAERNSCLHACIVEAVHAVRLQYLSDFKGKIFTRQASRADLETCHRLELMEGYELVPLLKSLSTHISSRPDYCTLDKRLMHALANPSPAKAVAVKPLVDKLVDCGTIFPAVHAKRGDMGNYRLAYITAMKSLIKEIERKNTVRTEESITLITSSGKLSPP